jgi:hypothetical protein
MEGKLDIEFVGDNANLVAESVRYNVKQVMDAQLVLVKDMISIRYLDAPRSDGSDNQLVASDSDPPLSFALGFSISALIGFVAVLGYAQRRKRRQLLTLSNRAEQAATDDDSDGTQGVPRVKETSDLEIPPIMSSSTGNSSGSHISTDQNTDLLIDHGDLEAALHPQIVSLSTMISLTTSSCHSKDETVIDTDGVTPTHSNCVAQKLDSTSGGDDASGESFSATTEVLQKQPATSQRIVDVLPPLPPNSSSTKQMSVSMKKYRRKKKKNKPKRQIQRVNSRENINEMETITENNEEDQVADEDGDEEGSESMYSTDDDSSSISRSREVSPARSLAGSIGSPSCEPMHSTNHSLRENIRSNSSGSSGSLGQQLTLPMFEDKVARPSPPPWV